MTETKPSAPGAMTPERLEEIRDTVEADQKWEAAMQARHGPTLGRCQRDRRDLLVALDAERERAEELEAEGSYWLDDACKEAVRANRAERGLAAEKTRAEQAERERDALRASLASTAAAWREESEARASAEESADAVLRYEDRVRLERERDEARAALAGLVEKARAYNLAQSADDEDREYNAWVALVEALAATPAALAGQARANVLREAAEEVRKRGPFLGEMPTFTKSAVDWIRTLADETERAK